MKAQPKKTAKTVQAQPKIKATPQIMIRSQIKAGLYFEVSFTTGMGKPAVKSLAV